MSSADAAQPAPGGTTDVLKTRLRQVTWNFIGRMAQLLSSFPFIILIAREIGQSAVGIAALPLTLYILFDPIVLNTQRRRIMQVETLEARDLSFFAMWGMLCAAVLAALSLIAATAAEAFHLGSSGQRAVLWMIVAVMAVAAVRAMATPYEGVLLRRHRYRSLAWIGTCAALIGGGVGYGVALSGAGSWSMVFYHLVIVLATVTMLRFASGIGGILPAWSGEGWRRHRVYLKSLVVSEGMQGASRQWDLLILPAFVAPTTMGLYFMARRMMTMLAHLLDSSVADPAFTAYSKARIAPTSQPLSDARALFLAILLIVILPAYVGLALIAPDLFPLMMGPEWREGYSYLQALALVSIILSLHRFMNGFFMATNETRFLVRLSAVKLAITVPTVVAAAFFGVWPVVWAMFVINCAMLMAQIRRADVVAPFNLDQEARMATRICVAVVLMAVVVTLVQLILNAYDINTSSPAGVTATVTAGAAAYMAASIVFNYGFLRHAVREMWRKRRGDALESQSPE